MPGPHTAMSETPTDSSSTTFDAALAQLDPSLFDAIGSQSSTHDRQSLLACQLATRDAHAGYVYLEIGSHLGGSLQPYVLDTRCRRIYSIDARPPVQPDERCDTGYAYPDNSTARMLEGLRTLSAAGAAKVTCIDADTRDVDPRGISERPQLCFIDGEHTDAAVARDFAFCRQVLAPDGAIVFHDANVIYLGLAAIVEQLRREGVRFRAYMLPDVVFVIELDGCRLHETPAIQRLLLDNHVGYLASLAANHHYRAAYRAYRQQPIIRLLRRIKHTLLPSR